jgi:hypothetical protein
MSIPALIRPTARSLAMQSRLGLLLAILLLVAAPLSARPPHKKALADHFGPLLPLPLIDCRTCHEPAPPASPPDALVEDRPHNPFGARLKAIKEDLRQAGKKTDIPTRLESIAEEDADRDGTPNLIELLLGHNPGEAADKPSATELNDGAKKLAAYRDAQKSYRWRPFDVVQRPAIPRGVGFQPADSTPQVQAGSMHHGSPLDAFLNTELAARSLRPRPEAPRHILLRRVYLDLIGLPPTPAELRAFLADDSPDAYEKVVDRLLASPQYGERWGRHWMDVWRYADWAGYGMEVRDSQRHIWRWRDWIVESLNEDKGYDRLIQEMLAGDEIAPTDPQTLRATGFLARNWYKFNRNVWLENTVEHTAKAFLGITMNCARCHDHFFDPISQHEYFAFRAFFEPYQVRTDRVPGEANLDKDGLPRVYDADLTAPTHLFVRGNEANPDKSRSFEPSVPALLGGSGLKIEPVNLPLSARAPDRRGFVTAETIATSSRSVETAREAIPKARRNVTMAILQASFDDALRVTAKLAVAAKPASGLALAELDLPIAEARHKNLQLQVMLEALEEAGQQAGDEWKQLAEAAVALQRRLAFQEAERNLLASRQAQQLATSKTKADADKKLAEAEKALATAEMNLKQPITTAYAKRSLPAYPGTSTGRRLALARWIADRQNPVTARVAVNHIWLRHFGRPLVPTVFDFGRNGQPPSHPALLDWLAAEFMEPGVGGQGSEVSSLITHHSSPPWSMKRLHRLIVTSAAYRRDSSSDTSALAADPDNKYLWRMSPRRMEAEVVRDSILHVADNLNPLLGGPDLDQNQGLAINRRSLYFRSAHEKQMTFLNIFDGPNVTECYQRTESVAPQQALALANSSLAVSQARLLARRLATEHADAAAFIAAAYERLLCRPPNHLELAECARFLEDQTKLLTDTKGLQTYGTGNASVPPSPDPLLRAKEDLVHVLLNHHEFVTIR